MLNPKQNGTDHGTGLGYGDDLQPLRHDFFVFTFHPCSTIACTRTSATFCIFRKPLPRQMTSSRYWPKMTPSHSSDGISVSVAESTLLNVLILYMWVTSRMFSQRVLRSFLGLLSWAGIHSRLLLPFLHAGHSFLWA